MPAWQRSQNSPAGMSVPTRYRVSITAKLVCRLLFLILEDAPQSRRDRREHAPRAIIVPFVSIVLDMEAMQAWLAGEAGCWKLPNESNASLREAGDFLGGRIFPPPVRGRL